MSSVIVPLVLALASAAAFGLATSLQHVSSSRLADHSATDLLAFWRAPRGGSSDWR
ncbi:MAG: hypothetical protein ACKOVB_07750 [Terrabacter sp.]